MDKIDKANESSISETILSSHSLTAVTAIITTISLLLLFINDRSVTLQIIFTLFTGLQFLFMLWMFGTILSVLYDAFVVNDQIFDLLVALDFYFMYIIVWSNTGMLFWVWDPTEDRSETFTNLGDLNSFSSWLVFFYITVFIMLGVGYGRYIADVLLSEAWAGILATVSMILFGMIISSVIARALENANNRTRHKNS